MKFAAPVSEEIDFSIIAGRVSTEDHDRVIELLDSLRRQVGQANYEVLLSDRLNDSISENILENYPEVHLIRCDAHIDLPTMRTLALKRAVGRYVAVTEDHCVPADDWLDGLSAILEKKTGASAVGGCVLNGVQDTGLDWATFLCEYSAFLPPVAEGQTDNLPGMNIAYRRSVFTAVPEKVLTRGFWETTLHPLLMGEGGIFISSNRVRMFHCKKFSMGLFLRQRFIYSRYFAGIRFESSSLGRRLFAATACVALPPLLLFRLLRSIGKRDVTHKSVVRAMPYLAAFYLVWAIGEFIGYLMGPADALRRIE